MKNNSLERGGSYLFVFLIISEHVGRKKKRKGITFCYQFLSEDMGRGGKFDILMEKLFYLDSLVGGW